MPTRPNKWIKIGNGKKVMSKIKANQSCRVFSFKKTTTTKELKIVSTQQSVSDHDFTLTQTIFVVQG